MKIIRLYTDDATATFDNIINTDDLIIPPDSQIALKSLVMEQLDSVIEINGENDDVTYQITSGWTETLQLSHGTYDAQNYGDLLDSFKLSLNLKSIFDKTDPDLRNPRTLGIEWDVNDNDAKTNIGYKIATQGYKAQHANKWKNGGNIVVVELASGKNRYSGNQNNPSANLNFALNQNMYMPYYVSRGNAYTRVKIRELSYQNTGGWEGFFIGLTTEKDIENNELDYTKIQYAVGVKINAGNNRYYYLEKDNYVGNRINPVDSGQDVVNYALGDINNDTLEIAVNGNQYIAQIYDHVDNDYVPIKTWDRTTEEDLYPFITFQSNGNSAQVSFVRTTLSKYQPLTSDVSDGDEPLGNPAPALLYENPDDNYLQFESNEVASFFGFDNPRNPVTGVSRAYQKTYISDKQLELRTLIDAMIVELQSHKLEAYDAYLNQEKSILAFIPQGNNDNMVVYEAPYLAFIDLANKEEIALNNIKARVVDGDYTPINLNGRASLVVVIKGKNE